MIVIWSLQNKLRFLSAGNKSSINHFEWIFKSFWLKRVTGVIIPILHGMNSSIELKQPKCCGFLTNLVGDQVGLGKKRYQKISKRNKWHATCIYINFLAFDRISTHLENVWCNSSIILCNYIRVTSTNKECTQCVSFHLAVRQVVGHPTTPRDLVSFSLGPNIDNSPSNRIIALN